MGEMRFTRRKMLAAAEPRLLQIAIALDEDVRFFTRKPPLLEAAP